ncbi:putative tail assembly protein [Pectobacterium phage MA12]|uniref:Putative tail assembly protein n=1 Tax=Pectobacterium phage MA12 TaxID=2686474 RepID=A0A6B9RJ30_9CAUD|nr:tail assembly protein [Pectobacterium phage MA11]YP_010000224.1 tail assembly protein [Pectobacterium phage MA12]QGF21050.1 putative tail assembly protein [Pectobacterium phage MA11]QHI00829.1 putative tail assembly protein [Pectobacterium phage MA12]
MMSYDTIENSIDISKPVFLYEIIYGPTPQDVYRYIAEERDQVAMNAQWKAQSIKHGDITSAGTLDKQALTVTARRDIEIWDLYRVAPPSYVVRLNIYRGQLDIGEFTTEWTGRILLAQRKDSEVEFSCEPISTSLRNPGLRRKYQYGCPHVLYDNTSCMADINLHTAGGTVLTVEGVATVVIQLAGAQNGINPGNLVAGIFRTYDSKGLMVRRAIVSAEDLGSRQYRLTLMSYIPDMGAGRMMSVSKGCLHTFAVCRDTFNNVGNFGGCPNIPTKNPFTSNQF